MPEAVLGLVRHRGAAFRPDELLARERVQAALDRGPFAPADRHERREPEHLPEHGSVLQQDLLGGRKRVQPGGDDPLHRLRERQPSSPELRGQARELLRIEGVSAGPVEERALQLGREHGPLQERGRSRAVSSSESGLRSTVAAFTLPPPQPGRRSSNSGRAVQIVSNGTSPAHSAR